MKGTSATRNPLTCLLYFISFNMKKIQIGHHFAGRKYKYPKMFALVDDDDYERLNKVKWSAYFNKWTRTFYARRCVEEGKLTTSEWMARVVMNAPKGVLVDHANHDTLDNRKANLRLATVSQNQLNRDKTVLSNSGFKGVYPDKRRGGFFASISVEGKSKWLGRYDEAHKAAAVYNEAAAKYHGEFAFLNVLPEIGVEEAN